MKKAMYVLSTLIVALIIVLLWRWPEPPVVDLTPAAARPAITITPEPKIIRVPGETKYFENIVIKEVPVDRIVEVPVPYYVYVEHDVYVDRVITKTETTYVTPTSQTPIPTPTPTPTGTPTSTPKHGCGR